MSYRPPLAVPLQPAKLWPAFGLLVVTVALGGGRHADAAPLPRDPVTEFRQALVQEKDAVKDKEALRYRRDSLTRRARDLTSLGEMARVLLLQEWRADAIGDPAADIDREVRDNIADRFINGIKEVLASGESTRREAAAELIAETAKNSRTLGLGFKANFLRKRLAGLAPDLAQLATHADPRVRQFAADALGNIQGDPKIVISALENLIKTGGPLVRRSAADALGNVVQISSQLERRVRSGEAGRVESRDEFLTTGTHAVPAAASGLAPDQSVEVRRLSADAIQQLSAALVDLTLDPFPADLFPPPGRPWTPEEAKRIEGFREDVAKDREQLRPILQTFADQSGVLTAASADPDPYVRIQVRQTFEDLAVVRARQNRREASIPKGESVPAPRPESKPEDKDAAPKSGGVYLPPAVTPTGVPVWLVSKEQEKAAPAADATTKELNAALPRMVAGLKDPNVRARLGAVEVLETMGTEAVPAIPALVESLRDPDRFVRWAAVRTLGRLAPREADLVVPAIARVLANDDLDVEVAAAVALERFGPAAKAAVPALGIRASLGDADIRIAAMRALEAVGTDAAPALPSVALNLVPKTRAEREQMSGPEVSALPPPRARVAAADTLGRFGKLAAAAVPVLQRSLNDIDADVRRAASEAILKITGK